MMTSPNGNIFRVTCPLWWESTRQRCIRLPKASEAELWCFLSLRLNKRLSKQSRRRWFETPSRSMWRHCNEFKWDASSGESNASPFRRCLCFTLSRCIVGFFIFTRHYLIDECRSSTRRVLYNTQLRNDSYIYIYIIYVYISKLIKLDMSFILLFC